MDIVSLIIKLFAKKKELSVYEMQEQFYILIPQKKVSVMKEILESGIAGAYAKVIQLREELISLEQEERKLKYTLHCQS